MAALTASMALVATACGGGDGGPPAGDLGGAEDGPVAGAGIEGLAGSWDEIVDAAADEGQLVLFTMRGASFEQWCQEVGSVMAEYEVEVDCTPASPSDWTGRVVAEQQGGAYLWDVLASPIGNVQTALKPIGGTQEIDPWMEVLPDEVTADEGWIAGLDVYSDDDRHIFIHAYTLSGGTYVNTDLAPQVTEASDLLDPDLRGQFVAYDPTNINDGSNSLSWFLADDEFGEEGVDFLIHEQQMTFVESPMTMLEWVADGRGAVGIGATRDNLAELQASGLGDNIEVLPFGEYLNSYGTAVLAQNPNPNATAVFLAWHLSQEGQQIWADVAYPSASSRRADVDAPNPEAIPDYENLDQYPPPIGTAEGTRIVEQVTEIALR